MLDALTSSYRGESLGCRAVVVPIVACGKATSGTEVKTELTTSSSNRLTLRVSTDLAEKSS